MKHPIKWLACLLLTLIPLLGCQEEPPLSPPEAPKDALYSELDPDLVARTIMATTGWPAVDEDGNPVMEVPAAIGLADKCGMFFVGREMIGDDIAHYEFRLQVGPGEYDFVGLHRVVKERRPHRPIRTRKSVFMVHGDYKNFVGCFVPGLYSATTPTDYGVAPYLAGQDVDVWGIDLGWALLPPELTDFGFMETWNMQRQIDDLRDALAVARVLRLFSGNGYRKMTLLGYSMGGTLGYCYLNDEVQRPPGRRHVKAYIPVDFGVKTDNEAFRDFICAYADYDQGLMDAGTYQYSSGFATVSGLARNDPDGSSPFEPSLTNLQFALAFGTFPAFGDPFTGHYAAGEFDAAGLPTDLQFMTIDQWLDFLDSGVPFGAVAFELDQTKLICNDEDLPYDDFLSEVTVPVLSVNAGGGLGEETDASLDWLGSLDVTRIVVSTSADPLLDFGHIDMFIGDNAEMLVWHPILEWILSHD